MTLPLSRRDEGNLVATKATRFYGWVRYVPLDDSARARKLPIRSMDEVLYGEKANGKLRRGQIPWRLVAITEDVSACWNIVLGEENQAIGEFRMERMVTSTGRCGPNVDESKLEVGCFVAL